MGFDARSRAPAVQHVSTFEPAVRYAVLRTARVLLSAAGAFCCALALQPGNEPPAGAPGQQTSTFCVREPSHRRRIGFGYTDSLADRPLFTFDLDSWISTTEDVDKCTFFSSRVARKPLSCNYYM